VSAEWFTKLKEIDSLQKTLVTLQKQTKNEDERVQKLENRQNQNLEELNLNQKELINLQDQMAQIDKEISFKTLQKQRLWEMGGDEIKSSKLSLEIAELEDKGFSLLDKIEQIKGEIQDKKTFASGIENTILEIQSEASDEIKLLAQEKYHTQRRIELLTEELPPNFKDTFLRVKLKNLTHGPFTKNELGHCYICRFKISKIDESEIDISKNLKTCPQCSRIFLPYGL